MLFLRLLSTCTNILMCTSHLLSHFCSASQSWFLQNHTSSAQVLAFARLGQGGRLKVGGGGSQSILPFLASRGVLLCSGLISFILILTLYKYYLLLIPYSPGGGSSFLSGFTLWLSSSLHATGFLNLFCCSWTHSASDTVNNLSLGCDTVYCLFLVCFSLSNFWLHFQSQMSYSLKFLSFSFHTKGKIASLTCNVNHDSSSKSKVILFILKTNLSLNYLANT